MSITDSLRLVGTPGTNKVMAGELNRLSTRVLSVRPPAPEKQGSGALVYPFDRDLAHLAVHYHRTSTRVLWDLVESRARRLEPLYDDVKTALSGDSRGWCWDGMTISVRARNVGAFAAGERQIVGAVKNAVVDALAARGIAVRVAPDSPDVLLTVRLHDDVVTVSVDLAGRSMSQRGYRKQGGVAPLREHLAAVLLMLARFDVRSDLLLDPMCGSGTIAIEGALMARGEPLWARAGAPPAADALPAFAGRPGARGPVFADAAPAIVANDVDSRAIDSARSNASDAGVDSMIHFARGDFRGLGRADVERMARESSAPGGDRSRRTDGPSRGLILCNPPYGERIRPADLGTLYSDLRDWCRQFRGWRAAFIVGNPELERAFRTRPRVRKPLSNGPIRGYFCLYEL